MTDTDAAEAATRVLAFLGRRRTGSHMDPAVIAEFDKVPLFVSDLYVLARAVRPAEVHAPAPTPPGEGGGTPGTDTEALRGIRIWYADDDAPTDCTAVTDAQGRRWRPSRGGMWSHAVPGGTQLAAWSSLRLLAGPLVETFPEDRPVRVPRVWQAAPGELPDGGFPQPGEVTVVRDREGDLWRLTDQPSGLPSGSFLWRIDTPDVTATGGTWTEVLAWYGPLTEVVES